MKKILFPCLVFCLLPGLFFACSREESQAETSVQKTQSVSYEKTDTNTIGMEFVLISAGSFMMGCDKNFEDCYDRETPEHRVNITKPFYLGKYEVTQTEWVAVMGSNPSKFKGKNNPVENISWNDAQEFILMLNQKEGGKKYRLPTEAEWEYAARAGTITAYSYGNDERQLEKYAWYDEDVSKGRSHPVGQLQPNPWGLHDMHGNVYEWVQDWFGDYTSTSKTDPQGPGSGEYRVLRGGGWSNNAEDCRSAIRSGDRPVSRSEDYGLRLAFSPGH